MRMTIYLKRLGYRNVCSVFFINCLLSMLKCNFTEILNICVYLENLIDTLYHFYVLSFFYVVLFLNLT